MNMRKKEILATLVMLTLMQGSVYAENWSHEYVADKDTEWGYVLYTGRHPENPKPGGRDGGATLHAGDKLTILNNANLIFDFSTDHNIAITDGGCIIYGVDFNQLPPPGQFVTAKVLVTGEGTIYGKAEKQGSGFGIWNYSNYDADIQVDKTNFQLEDFQRGIYASNGDIVVEGSDFFSMTNVDEGIRTKAEGNVSIETEKFTMQNLNTGIYSEGNSIVTLNNSETRFENGGCAIYQKDASLVDIKGEKLDIINTSYAISNNNSITNIKVNEFNYLTTEASSNPTAIYGGLNAQINVNTNKAYLCGNIEAYDNANINFLDDPNSDEIQNVTILSDWIDAVSSESDDGNAKINFEVNSYINSQGDEIYHADKQGVRTIAAIRALRNSEITLDNAAGVYGDIIAGRGIDNSDATGGKITINSVDYADFKGDVLAGNDGVIDLTLNNANYEGRVDDYADATLKDTVFRPEEFDVAVTDGGTVNMTLNNSAWTARGQNFVTKLDFGAEGGLVDLSQDENNSVTIRNLNGNGTFNMLLNSEDHSKSDMLYIGKNTGSQTINIVGGITGGLENISEDNPLRFATVGIDSVSDVPDVNNSGISAYTRDGGVFDVEYTVEKEDFDKADAENEKYNGTGDGKGVDKPGNDFVENALVGNRDAVNWIITGAKEKQESDAGKTIINMSKVNYNNAIYMDRLNKRLGEARYISPEDEQGMWVRIRHDRIGKDDAFRSQNTMYEMGYDEKQDCDNGERRVGFAIDYMDGKAEYSGIAGDGDVKRYGLWLYDTWMGDKGHYADYVAKWGHLENDFDIMARSTGEKITGDYSNNVFSVSAEYGRKKDIGNNWYFEPQAQLQLARVTGASYTTSQNTDVTLDGINSLIGRAGFRLGRDVNERSTVYVKADLLHEFLGDQTITATDVTGTLREEYENKGTWYDVGFGFATALGKDSYAFMDFEKSFGNDNDETYQINAGVRWTF